MSSKPSPAAIRRPFEGIFSLSTFFKNQAHEKPLRNALYNAAVIGGLGLISCVLLVLWPFFKPMLWAFLFGAVLFPAKRNISNAMHSWLDRMENEQRPFLVALVIIPIETLDRYGKNLLEWVVSHLKIIVIGSISLLGIKLLVSFVPSQWFIALLTLVSYSHQAFGLLTGSLTGSLVLVLIVGYALSVVLIWDQNWALPFQLMNHVLWVVLMGYMCSFLGAFQVPAFLFLFTYCVIAYVLHEQRKASETSTPSEGSSTPSNTLETVEKSKKPSIPEILGKRQDDELESDQYFKILFYACTVTILWKYTWIIFLAMISTSVYVSKWLAQTIGISYYTNLVFEKYGERFKAYYSERYTALIPVWLPGLIQLNAKIHKYVCQKAKSYVDDLSSVIVILGLFVAIIFISVFSFIQIYSETIAVAQLGSNLINRTIAYRPDLIDMLPIDMKTMDDVIDNAHKYGRTTISEYVDSIFNDTDASQAKKLKVQILTVWDRLIQSYLDRNNGDDMVGPRVNGESLYDSLGEIVTNPSTKAGIIEWAKSNLGMIMEVGDSVWLIVRTNLTLLLSAIGTLFSVILGGGHAVLKFLFNSIIFFTCLYYLLQSSREKYAPIATNTNSQWGTRLANAIEGSISSVLVATLKLALFHGLFTWLTHTIFGAHIVYLPAVLASLLAAAPFLETYWCSLPAFLDLWLSQDKFWIACTLVLIHFIVPSNFNPIIHSEIKGGGHPYLTGLSIAGGMYLFGLEGAVIGPLLLCLLVVLFDVTKIALKDSPGTPYPATRQPSIDATGSDFHQQPFITSPLYK